MKPIPNFDGYFITEEGKVFCNLGMGPIKTRVQTSVLREVKPRPGKTGYMRVYMRDSLSQKRKDRYVHRLVAEAFIPNPHGKRTVNHIDSDRSNNCIDNLEWATHKENLLHAEEYGLLERCPTTGKMRNKIKNV